MKNKKELILKAKKLYENKNFFEAKSHLENLLKNKNIEKNLKLNICVLISDICYKLNDFVNAEKYLKQSIGDGKLTSEVFNLLGNIYLKRRDYTKSEKSYLKSIAIDENNQNSLINLAILYHNLGIKKKAILFYKKVLKKNTKNFGVLYNLSNIEKTVINGKTIEELKKSIEKKNINNFDLASSYFLLAEVERKKKNFKKELNLLEKANNLSFLSNKNKNNQFNQFWLKDFFKKIDQFEYMDIKESTLNTKEFYPIFIVGLPRCGSTLIESVISSGHDKVANLGETNLINWAFLNTNKDSLTSSDKKIKINFKAFKEKFSNVIENFKIKKSDKKIIFSDKSLENFYYIELILNLYPNAKFIHSHRNLADNVIAIYKKFLPIISWSHSLEDILLYIENYLLILEKFKKKYPKNLFFVSLEEFTTNPKESSKNIYKFCNLKWSDDCLNFYKRNDLFINTASNNQMRSNIEKYNDNKYEPYKEILNIYLKKYSWLNN